MNTVVVHLEEAARVIDAQFDLPQDVLDAYPLMYPSQMVGLMALYVVMVFTLPLLMSLKKEPFQLHTIGFVWNILMTALSAYMFAGYFAQFVTNVVNHWGNYELYLCDPQVLLSDNTEYWTYLFYLSKFLEYTDTVFLILRKKEVIFLHWYHHMVTCTIVWSSWLYLIPANQWMGPLTNSFVHIFMYAYFALTEMGLDRKWGKYVTMIQLAQFYFAIVMFIVVGINYGLGNCASHTGAFLWLFLQYAIFLVLFVRMDRKRRAAIAKKKRLAQEKKSK